MPCCALLWLPCRPAAGQVHVVCTTVVGAGSYELLGRAFPFAVLDEASQCAETEALCALMKGVAQVRCALQRCCAKLHWAALSCCAEHVAQLGRMI